MESNISNLVNNASTDIERYLCDQARNELANNWLLTRSIWPSICFITTYLIFVLKIGPAFMKNREAFTLKPIILAFNLYLFSANTYMWLRFLTMGGGITYLYENACHPADHVESRFCREESFMIWYFYTTKITDLFETVFFVLRKKQSQVTFLHTYHHTCMVLAAGHFGITLSGTTLMIIGGINTVVHSIMYLYYFLSAIGPSMQKYLWWKIYVTRLQMVQFVIIIAFMMYLMKNQCALPKGMTYIVIFREGFFFVLFLNFYIRSYVKRKAKTDVELKKEVSKQELDVKKES